jgi:hypothetical protein
MNFTYTEKYGEKPISKWLNLKIKDYAKERYGVEIRITINPKYAKYVDEYNSMNSPTPDN